MLRYLLYRLAGLLMVLLVVTFVAFFLSRAVPGGPYDEIQQPLSPAGLFLPPQRIDELSEPFGNSIHQTRSGL